MPTKQTTSEQPLVEVTQANGDICHVNLQGGCQKKSHAGCTYDLDCCAVGTQDVLGRLLIHGQAMGIRPLINQQGDGHAHVNYHQALSSLAPELITPYDLPGSNTDGEVWLISLLLSFGWLRPWLGCLEPACRHTYLLDDQGIGCPKQGAWRVGYWGLWHGGWRCDNQHGHYMQDVVLDLLSYLHYGVLGSCQHIVH